MKCAPHDRFPKKGSTYWDFETPLPSTVGSRHESHETTLNGSTRHRQPLLPVPRKATVNPGQQTPVAVPAVRDAVAHVPGAQQAASARTAQLPPQLECLRC
eukprot:640848-Prymnesium_polylepis.1